MIIPERVQCDICKATRDESARWIVAVENTKSDAAQVTFAQSREAFRDTATGELPTSLVFADLCGQECAHTQLSRWFDSHPNVASAPATATPESVTA